MSRSHPSGRHQSSILFHYWRCLKLPDRVYFGRWVIDSFLETEYLVSRDDFPHSWHICVQLFLPFCIYFRFVSVLLLLKIKVLFTQTAALKTKRRRESQPPPAPADFVMPDWLFGPDTECLIDAQEEPPMANPGLGLHVKDAQPSTSRCWCKHYCELFLKQRSLSRTCYCTMLQAFITGYTYHCIYSILLVAAILMKISLSCVWELP